MAVTKPRQKPEPPKYLYVLQRYSVEDHTWITIGSPAGYRELDKKLNDLVKKDKEKARKEHQGVWWFPSTRYQIVAQELKK
jgi:hypothetical protein